MPEGESGRDEVYNSNTAAEMFCFAKRMKKSTQITRERSGNMCLLFEKRKFPSSVSLINVDTDVQIERYVQRDTSLC